MTDWKHGFGHRAEDIARSAALVALVTEHYVTKPGAREDVEAAERAGIPILAVLDEGVTLPAYFPPRTVVVHYPKRMSTLELVRRVKAELELHGVPSDHLDIIDGELQ